MIPGLAAKGMPKEQIAEVLANLRTTVGRPATTSTGITSPPCVNKSRRSSPGTFRTRAHDSPSCPSSSPGSDVMGHHHQRSRLLSLQQGAWNLLFQLVSSLRTKSLAPQVEPAVHGFGWVFETTLTAMFGWIRHHADVPRFKPSASGSSTAASTPPSTRTTTSDTDNQRGERKIDGSVFERQSADFDRHRLSAETECWTRHRRGPAELTAEFEFLSNLVPSDLLRQPDPTSRVRARVALRDR